MEVHPTRLATVYRERKRTWREVGERVARVGSALAAMGVDEGECVPILAYNNDRYVELFYAIPWAGGVVVPLNIRWAQAEFLPVLKQMKPRVIFLDDSFLGLVDVLKTQIGSLRHIVSIGELERSDPSVVDYEELILRAIIAPDRERGDSAPYTRFYTGGTTGAPRPVTLSHKNVVFASLSYIAQLQLTHEMVHMHVGGMFHLSGAGHMWYTTMVGGCHVILPKFEVAPVLEAIHRHRVTNTVLLPTMVNMLLADSSFDLVDLTSMRMCIYGGSPMPEALIEEFIKRLPTWSFTQVYAMTETCGLATFLPWRRHFATTGETSKLKSVGQAALGVEIKILDAHGNAQQAGVVGEIAVRGANVTEGQPLESGESAVFVDGFLRTGDLGRQDEDGFVFLVDRAKDMIISGGENVYSAEVENVLYRHSSVRECAVIGAPDETWGEIVIAIVVPKDGQDPSESELLEHCRRLLGNFKCPKRVVMRREPLPLSPAGKIKKDVLREPYWGGRRRRIN